MPGGLRVTPSSGVPRRRTGTREAQAALGTHGLDLPAGDIYPASAVIMLLTDFGMTDKSQNALQLPGMCCMGYCSQLCLTSPHGYGFLRGEASQAANRQFEDSPNAFTCSAGHTLLRDDLAGEAAIPDDIFVAARDLLSEEAVRCAVKILQLKNISVYDRQSRQQLPGVWIGIVAAHLQDGAPYPVSVDQSERRRLCRMVVKACRRKVLFADDCDRLNNQFFKVLGHLATILKPVLAAYYTTNLEEVNIERGQSPPRSPNQNMPGSSVKETTVTVVEMEAARH